MPSDIRSFFGGKPAGTAVEKPKPKEDKKRGRVRKVIEDDDDDDDELVELVPKKASPKKKKGSEPPPKVEETTAGDFFGSSNKPKRSEVPRPKSNAQTSTSAQTTPKKTKDTKAAVPKVTPNGRASTRAKKTVVYNEDLDFPSGLDEDNAEQNPISTAAVSRKTRNKHREGKEGDDDESGKPLKRGSERQLKLKAHDQDFDPDEDIDMKETNDDDDFVVPDDDEETVFAKPANRSAASRKRKSAALEDEYDQTVSPVKSAKKRASPTKRSTPSTKAAKMEPLESTVTKAIFDSIPTIEAPPPPSTADEVEKPKFRYGQHANSQAPAIALDPSELPHGEDNCLAGLTFVFTGQLDGLGREQGQNLVKQYGGKVTTAPSKKTSYVVLGDDAGPKKLQTIKDYSLKVINKVGLFELIKRLPANGGDSVAAEKQAEKRAKEEENIRKAAEEIEREERSRLAAAKPKPHAVGGNGCSQSNSKQAAAGPDTRLWTVRYAPNSIQQICGNKGVVEKLQRWLHNFPTNQRKHFKLGGPDGSGAFRAVMIHGPPGIGKTTAAHLVAKLEGYDIVESNASDTRSKKLVETGLKGVLSTTSLMGYFSAGGDAVEASKKKLVLIMDEVDGMSAGDRGGVGALAAVCKKSEIPMILICNERRQPKMKPFDFCTFDLPFRRPTTDQIRSRIMTIAFREELKIPTNVIDALIQGSNTDIRQVINMISTAKLDSKALSFEEGKDMSKRWEKHVILKPFDMANKILGGGLFNPASQASLNDKQELYFNDHEMAALMLQENYLNTKPQRGNRYDGNPKMRNLASLELANRAASSISDGDLVDRMIHGSQQQWSLLPTHAMFSFVRPASFVYGSMAGNRTQFTALLGKMSNMNKLTRFVKEVQGHMRLRTSADRHEIRQTYLPLLFEKLIRRLQQNGKESVPDVIELMDYYYLTREDWDAILELGVGNADMEKIKIETATKATFTRLYNAQAHPMPFMKASQVVAPKKAPAKERPDLEEALDESDEAEVMDDDAENKEDDEEVDLSKDKYVKQPKKRKAGAAAPKPATSKKRKTNGEDDGVDESDVEEKPKKSNRGKGKAKK